MSAHHRCIWYLINIVSYLKDAGVRDYHLSSTYEKRAIQRSETICSKLKAELQFKPRSKN